MACGCGLQKGFRRDRERNGWPEEGLEQVIGAGDWKILGCPYSLLQAACHVFCPVEAQSVHSVLCVLFSWRTKFAQRVMSSVKCSTKCTHVDIGLSALLLPLINCTFVT
jgi:hypothetical protein